MELEKYIVTNSGNNINTFFLFNNDKFKTCLEGLFKIIYKYNTLEGNCLCDLVNNKLILRENYENSRKNLFYQTKNVNNILEIGFNSGFSTLLMLLSNNYSKILCIDICRHIYTKECFKFLQTEFPERLTLIEGDSQIVLKEINFDFKFDFVEIDGNHTYEYHKNDLLDAMKFTKKGTIIFMDDLNNHGGPKTIKSFEGKINKYYIKDLWDKFIELKIILPVKDWYPNKYHGLGIQNVTF